MAIITLFTFNGYRLGVMDPDTVSVRINPATAVITCYAVNSETGEEVVAPPEYDHTIPFLEGIEIGRVCGFSSYSGDEIVVYGSSSNPFGIVQEIIEDSPSCGVAPPSCDLSLSAVSTNETSQDANDGTVTLSSTTSFGPAQYSLDGVTFTGVMVYSGLAPGNYIAYSKDANACTANQPFTIEAFNNPIDGGFDAGLPQVEISPGNISRWNAAFNPIVLNFSSTPDPAKTNFRIEIEITSDMTTVTGSWSPGIDGKTRCDISTFLKTLVNAKDDFKYDVFNYLDTNRAAAFSIRYREVWDSDASEWFDAPSTMYVTYSAKQLGDKHGGNMAKYVTFLNEPNPDLKAEWLTLFEEPTAWSGLPFDNAFILSEYLSTSDIKLRTLSLDINKQPYGGATFGYLLRNDAGYILANDYGRLIVNQGSLPDVTNSALVNNVGINRLMLAGSPGVGVEYFQIQLYTGEDDAPNFITKPLTLKVNRPCTDPYVYLKWLNTLGGWDYWRFGHDQILSLTTSDEITVDRNVFDWENDDTISDTIKKNSVQKIAMGDIVPNNKVNGLIGIHKSIKIQKLTSTNPYKWQTVTLATGSFQIKKAKNNFSELKLTIDLPEDNIQSQ